MNAYAKFALANLVIAGAFGMVYLPAAIPNGALAVVFAILATVVKEQ